MQGGEAHFNPLEDLLQMLDETCKRPREQWWMDLRPIAKIMAQRDPANEEPSTDGGSN
jgi:6-phosphofructokinase 1